MPKGTKAARQAIIDACLDMNASGLNQGTSGNISTRHGKGMLITPSGLPYDRMTPADIVWVGFDGTVEGGKPSSEWRFHHDILATRPEVNAVVHTHATACTTLAILGKGIPPLHYMIAMAGGPDIRCGGYATFGTAELSQIALEALAERWACLLAHHGMIALGETLPKAMWRAMETETLAKQYLGCLPFGEPPLLALDEIDKVLGLFADYGHKD